MTEQLTLRLTVQNPVAGLHYSLQDARNGPVDVRLSNGTPLSFDVPITLKPERTLAGPFVRREGKQRRFVYIAISGQVPEFDLVISRRAKIDVHDIPAELLRSGTIIEAILPGRGKDGTPSCATVRPLSPWRVID